MPANPYEVTISISSDGQRRMIVKRSDGKPIRCGWDVFQRLKNEYLGREVVAVEVFPPASEVVNEVNYRHFWEVQEAPSLCRR